MQSINTRCAILTDAATVWVDKTSAAIKIQTAWRGKSARNKLKGLKRQALILQRIRSMERHDLNRWKWQDAGRLILKEVRFEASKLIYNTIYINIYSYILLYIILYVLYILIS